MAVSKRSSKKRRQSLNIDSRLKIILALTLVILGSLSIFASTASKTHLRLTGTKTAEQYPIYAQNPTTLYIPRINKTLTITDGYVMDNRWAISDSGVSYLTSSAVPGTFGNSVIYGHNLSSILGSLPKVRAGDPIYVVLSNGDIAHYQVMETKEVKPTDVQILESLGDSRLTIYTCSGFLDTARFVVVARLVEEAA